MSLVCQCKTITAIAGTRASLKANAVTTGGFTGPTTPRVVGLPEGLRAALAPASAGSERLGLPYPYRRGRRSRRLPRGGPRHGALGGLAITRSAGKP